MNGVLPSTTSVNISAKLLGFLEFKKKKNKQNDSVQLKQIEYAFSIYLRK